MKRLLGLFLMVLLLNWSGSAGAMGLGGPGQLPGKGHLALGLQSTWMAYSQADDTNLKSTLRNQGQSWSETNRIGQVKLDNDVYTMATFSYGLLDDLGFSLGLGMARGAHLRMDNSDAKLRPALVWSLGAKYRLFEDKNGVGVILSARCLLYGDREISDWRINGQSSEESMGYLTDDSADFHQLDGAVTLYWKLGPWTPYLGAGITYWDMSYQGNWYNPTNGASIDYEATLRNQEWLTALAGFQLNLGQGLELNLDGVFVGYAQVGLSLNYTF